jgi:hypothetical protein
MHGGRSRRRFGYAAAAAVAAAVIGVVPAAGVLKQQQQLSARLAQHLSSGVLEHFWATNPGAAPAPLKMSLSRFAAAAPRLRGTRLASVTSCVSSPVKDLFNCDNIGLPQNEESVSACTANDTTYVLGGTNDYRGLLDPDLNFTGWEWSVNGGRSVTNEGLLPTVDLVNEAGQVPSGGDPVDFLFSDPEGCHAFAASLANNPTDPLNNPNGIAVYASDPTTLSTCPGGSDPSCWPTRRLVVENAPNHLLDKPWMFVGVQDSTPYVWVTYGDFDLAPANPDHAFEASVKAVRCTIDLVTCTAPITISTVDDDVSFSDVTIGPDGKAYITWSRIDGELDGTDQTFTHKIRVETAPGSATFGSEHVIYAESDAIPFGGFLQANDFRIATYMKSDVASVAGHPRVFAVWDACNPRLLGTVCEFPEIKLSYSDDAGATWSGPFVISKDGVNYFPTISVDRADPSNTNAAVAWYSSSDHAFWNQQDVVRGTINTAGITYGPAKTKRLKSANEPEADPLLGGFFIGDYFEVALVNNRAYTHYNANFRQVPLLGPFGPPFSTSPPVNQQDNYLSTK